MLEDEDLDGGGFLYVLFRATYLTNSAALWGFQCEIQREISRKTPSSILTILATLHSSIQLSTRLRLLALNPTMAFSFGTSTPAPAFGAPAAAPAGGLFGAPAPAPSGGLFGAAAPAAPAPAGGLFGAAPAPAAGGLFGSGKTVDHSIALLV
jgi:hypothetical protein